jgi:hypothetical protein
LCVFAAWSACLLWAHGTGASNPSLARTKFEAKGRNETILTIPQFGRYAILTKSKQGTALQLVDRMWGPGASDGVPGGQDGRLDLILDAGTYKLVATSSEQGSGPLTLSAKSFAERSEKAPLLREELPVEGQLDDFQQASYWIHVTARQTVYIEALGRNLADIRLWYEGNWLLPDNPEVTEKSPVLGQPQARCLIIATLDPGSYLLTAYGGPPKPWPKETGEHPFHLRLGLPSLDSNTRLRVSVSPFGTDRYLVPAVSDTFVLQLAEKRDFRLEAKDFAVGDSLEPFDQSAAITKKSQDPECRLLYQCSKDYTLVSVVGPPGEPYDLQVFQRRQTVTLREPGHFFVGTLHSGSLGDNIDSTGILVSDIPQEPHVTPTASDVIHLGAGKGWARKFNLLEDESVFFFVEEAGAYEARSEGTACSLRFEPFMLNVPPNYAPPAFKSGDSTWNLDPGYWVLALSPQHKGIATVAIRKKGGLWQTITGALFGQSGITAGPAKGACRLPDVIVEPGHEYVLHLNNQEGIETGIIVRPLPLDLSRALPLTLLPDEAVTLPFHATTAGRLMLTTDSRQSAEIQVDGTACKLGCDIAPGDHNAIIRNKGGQTAVFVLGVTPADRLPEGPPAYLPVEVSAAFGQFPTLTERAPLFFDLARGESKTALLNVAEPSLYRIETTGLLATSCTIRTRTQTHLFEDTSGGVGRNSLVQAYLKPGEYQVTVRAEGNSAGHLGLRAVKTPVTEGGPLILGGDVKEAVPAGSAVLHPFTLSKRAVYALATIGVGKTFKCRLEDAEGWPLLAPDIPAKLRHEFVPGLYRYLSLPWDVDTLRDTRLEEVVPPAKVEGRGPHAISLNERLENVWREPPKGAPRERDLYDFIVPAEVDATIALSEPQMQAYLKRQEATGGGKIIEEMPAGKNWSGRLASGNYRLEVECSRQNDLLPYSVSVSAAQLVPGLSQTISVPAEIPVSLSKEGVVELYSSGDLDVLGKLYRNFDGKLVAVNDDDTNNWNFRIAHKLTPGLYTLHVERVGGGTGTVSVTMSVPEETRQPNLNPPVDQTVELLGKINVFPLPSLPQGAILAVTASADSDLGLSLEKSEGGAVQTLASSSGRNCQLLLPAKGGAGYQIRLWSRDHQSETARLRIGSVSARSFTEAEAGSGFRPAMLAVAGLHLGLASIHISSPGSFNVEPHEGLLISSALDEAMAAPLANCIGLPNGSSTLAWKAEASKEISVRVARAPVRPGAENSVRLAIPPGGEQWLDIQGGRGEILLLTATSDAGIPACAFDSGRGSSLGPVLIGAFDFISKGCVSAALGQDTTRARVWNGDPEGTALPPITVRAESFKLPAKAPPLSFGPTSGEVAPRECRSYVLPAGPKELVLDLTEGGVAILCQEGVSRIAAAHDGPIHWDCQTTDSRLFILNPSSQKAIYALSCLDGPSVPEPEIAAGGLFEKVFSEPGTVRIRVKSAPDETWHLLASAQGAILTVMDWKGLVHSGSPVSISGPGYAWLTHKAGLAKIWMVKEGEGLDARWGAPIPAAIPAPENSAHLLLGKVAAFKLNLPEAGVLHAETEKGCTLALRDAAADSRWIIVREGTTTCSFDEYLEPGSYVVMARGTEGQALAGTLRTLFSPASQITGTLGPETLVGDGESRTFVFTVKTAGQVGIGLKSESDRLTCELMTKEGRLLGSGIQQFIRLEPGVYLLRVTADSGAAPVRFSPVVVGLEPPGLGPPKELLQEFLSELGISGKGE